MLLPIAHFQMNIFIAGNRTIFLLFNSEYTFDIQSNGTYFDWQQIGGTTLAINDVNIENPTITRPTNIEGPFFFEVYVNRRANAVFHIVTSPFSEIKGMTIGGLGNVGYQKEWGVEKTGYAVNVAKPIFKVTEGETANVYFHVPARHASDVIRYEIFLRDRSTGVLTLVKQILANEETTWLAEIGNHYLVRTHLYSLGRNHVIDSDIFYIGTTEPNRSEWIGNSQVKATIGGHLDPDVNWRRSVYAVTRIATENPQENTFVATIGGTMNGSIDWRRNVYTVQRRETNAVEDTFVATIGGTADFSNINWNRSSYYSVTT